MNCVPDPVASNRSSNVLQGAEVFLLVTGDFLLIALALPFLQVRPSPRHPQAFPHLPPALSSLLQLESFLLFFSSLDLSHLHLIYIVSVLPLGGIYRPDLGHVGSFVQHQLQSVSHHVLQE